ncbi:MAG: ABC transporter ATP-binding protein [Candidatus Krumholzibacteriota bacterium]|nr:ABC transporter ATP-binding protein [Candidatus Krumholzibacteriota bacterium]
MIEVTKVSKSFKDVDAVRSVSFQVRKGEFVALLGPNGAGKTTLVEMIEGLRKPDSGEISIDRRNWKSDERYLRSVMGISLQETRFIDKLTIDEIMTLFAGFYGRGGEGIAEILDLVGLTEKRRSYTMNLSGGQRQKLALGIALINEPSILILDEPTTGLDPNARREIWDILQNLRSNGTSMILTTHYMEEAEHLCDRIIIMNRGEVIAEGTLDELLEKHGACEVISFTLGAPSIPDSISKLDGVISFAAENSGGAGRLCVDDIVAVLPGLLSLVERERLDLKRLECRKMNLDDLFVSLTGRRLHDQDTP